MKSTLSIMTIVGTRPELIRLSRIIPLLDAHVRHVLVHTQQNYDYELSGVFLKELEIREPDYSLNVGATSTVEQIGNILTGVDPIIEKEQPDAIFILGDTNTSLVAYLARRRHIPIFHMEAGNRSFDWNVPEEINRRVVDHLSDVHLCYSEHARSYLLREGVHPGSVYVVGSPLAEVFDYYRERIRSSDILKSEKLEDGSYFVASIHREENVDNPERLSEIINTLQRIGETNKMPVLVSLHPRTKKRLKEFGVSTKKLRLTPPWGYFDFIRLQQSAYCVLSDSGSLPEEASIVGFPAVQLRVSTERPEAYDSGAVILSGPNSEAVESSVQLAVSQVTHKNDTPEAYTRLNVSQSVVKLILGLANVYRTTEMKPLSY